MANRLSMAKVNAILSLHQSGHSNRRLASAEWDRSSTLWFFVAFASVPCHDVPVESWSDPGREQVPTDSSIAGRRCVINAGPLRGITGWIAADYPEDRVLVQFDELKGVSVIIAAELVSVTEPPLGQ
jgi:hypothetical protein